MARTPLPNGRPPDPETQAEAQALAERFVAQRAKKYLQVLDQIAMNEETPADQRRMAIAALFERGLGKAAVPEKDNQLGQLERILKEVAKIAANGSNKPSTRVVEVQPRTIDSGSEDGSDPGRSLPTPTEEGSLDHSTSTGDS